MDTDQSYGIIAYRQTSHGQPEFLLVQHLAGHWGFPKGHLDADEQPIEAAKRELAEETGIEEIRVGAEAGPTFQEQYVFTKRSQRRVVKQVTYFLGEVLAQQASRELTLAEGEIVDGAWGDAKTSRSRLTFPEGKALLDEVVDYLARTHNGHTDG